MFYLVLIFASLLFLKHIVQEYQTMGELNCADS